MSGYKPLSAGARQAKLLSRIGAETNKNELTEAQVLLRRAIGNELTDRQRDCVQLYYGERLTMQEIADELHPDARHGVQAPAKGFGTAFARFAVFCARHACGAKPRPIIPLKSLSDCATICTDNSA